MELVGRVFFGVHDTKLTGWVATLYTFGGAEPEDSIGPLYYSVYVVPTIVIPAIPNISCVP